jgi:Uma2 family endonuclease
MATDLHAPDSFAPQGLDSDALKFYEVVDGQILENPPMGAMESVLAGLLSELMAPFARAGGLGRVVPETLFLIDRVRNLKRRPDLAFVSDQRWALRRRIPQTEAWDVVPDLAVEVVSGSNSANSVVIKLEEYFRAGTRKVWVVYPVVSKVYVYDAPDSVRILQPGGALDGEDLLPGFRVALSTLFEELGDEPGGEAAAGEAPEPHPGD